MQYLFENTTATVPKVKFALQCAAIPFEGVCIVNHEGGGADLTVIAPADLGPQIQRAVMGSIRRAERE